jgi:ATP-binding cassette, subfamily B, bacterial
MGGINLKNIKLLLKFMKGNTIIFFLAIISILLASLFAIVMPLVIKTTIDSIIGKVTLNLPTWILNIVNNIGGKDYLLKNLWICGLVLLGLTAAHGFFVFLKGRLSSMASENSGKKIKEQIYDHIMHLPFDYHVKSKAGDLIQRCTSDVETIQNFVSSQFIEIGQSIITFTFILIIMFSMDSTYSFVSIAFVPIILGATILFFNSMKKIFKQTDESEGRMTSTIQENLTGVRVVKAFGAQSFETEKFEEKNKEYRDNVYKIVILMSKFWSITDFLCMVQFALVILTGIYWKNTGVITLGTFIAFITYAGMMIWPIRQLGQTLAFAGQAFVSLTRVQEVLDTPIETPVVTEVKSKIVGDIEFSNVYFEYNQEAPIIKNLSFKIKRGQTVAILGATGSGKSSIMHLLLRLYDYQKGSIKIDGIELKEIERKWLRKHIGIVLQEPFLFSKSIIENIRFGKANAPDPEIHASSDIAAIHETILAFEKGYETMVGERGVTLSGGQRQRLAIARAVIGNYPILIFDDSLSAVDMETDLSIRRALKHKNKNTTTIIISHRITTLAEADVIMVLDDGNIKQSGTHEELVNQEGLYKRVWELQSSIDSELEYEDIV